jgi:MSHA biogenesis protein MshP
MMKFSIKLQRGFSLVTAIFLLVVLGGLGTMMVTFFVAQQQSSALDVMGSRAYQAARAGIEWAAYQVSLTPVSSVAPVGGCETNFAQNTLAGKLAPFTVSVTCTAASAVEGASTIWIFDIASSAVSGGAPGNPDYVERVINVKLGR